MGTISMTSPDCVGSGWEEGGRHYCVLKMYPFMLDEANHLLYFTPCRHEVMEVQPSDVQGDPGQSACRGKAAVA